MHAELLRNERISAKAGDGKVTLSSFASAVSAGKLSGLDLHQLNIIMKVDVQVSPFFVLSFFTSLYSVQESICCNKEDHLHHCAVVRW